MTDKTVREKFDIHVERSGGRESTEHITLIPHVDKGEAEPPISVPTESRPTDLVLTMEDATYLVSLGDRAKGALTTSVARQWFYDFAARVKATVEVVQKFTEGEPRTGPRISSAESLQNSNDERAHETTSRSDDPSVAPLHMPPLASLPVGESRPSTTEPVAKRTNSQTSDWGFSGHIAVLPKEDAACPMCAKPIFTEVPEPVAYRVKDFGDGWVLHHTLAAARDEADGVGNLIQPLYAHPLPVGESCWMEETTRQKKNALIRQADALLHIVMDKELGLEEARRIAADAHAAIHALAGILSDDPEIRKVAANEGALK